ncbi:unnamed protein product [Clavelina lepadiformis]|uniref:Uncharacterized protein n=1 Tax=Clavelina lepadiformis TaxID=159417 RepID=A0ABP0G6P3_CLALP
MATPANSTSLQLRPSCVSFNVTDVALKRLQGTKRRLLNSGGKKLSLEIWRQRNGWNSTAAKKLRWKSGDNEASPGLRRQEDCNSDGRVVALECRQQRGGAETPKQLLYSSGNEAIFEIRKRRRGFEFPLAMVLFRFRSDLWFGALAETRLHRNTT